MRERERERVREKKNVCLYVCVCAHVCMCVSMCVFVRWSWELPAEGKATEESHLATNSMHILLFSLLGDGEGRLRWGGGGRVRPSGKAREGSPWIHSPSRLCSSFSFGAGGGEGGAVCRDTREESHRH